MLDFTYYAPTKVFFGKGRASELGEILTSYHISRVLFLYGGGSIKRMGLYDTVCRALEKAGIFYVEMGGVSPNPKIEFVKEAIALAKRERVELVLAVGGGSVIDAAKYTAIGAKSEYDIWDYPSGARTVEAALPVGCILTHAAAGSEMSGSAVLSKLDEGMKRGVRTDFNRPLFSILDPTLTYTVSPYQTACGAVDMLTHTLERYLIDCPPTPVTDKISIALLRSIVDAAPVAIAEPQSYEARASLMWASSLAHNDLTGAGRGNSLAVHQLEHALSGAFDEVAHGAGLAVLFPAWMRYVADKAPARLATLARELFDVEASDDHTAAMLGADAMEHFFTSLGMPNRLSAFGVSEKDLPRLAFLTTFGKKRVIPSLVPLDYEAVLAIFTLCL